MCHKSHKQRNKTSRREYCDRGCPFINGIRFADELGGGHQALIVGIELIKPVSIDEDEEHANAMEEQDTHSIWFLGHLTNS